MVTKKAIRKIGVLTGGGDCPGLNAAIRAVVRRAHQLGYRVIGIKNGWRGLLDISVTELDSSAVSGILPKGGTILGTSRTNPYKHEGGKDKLIRNFENLGLEALIAIGGEDTLGVAARLWEEDKLPIVGIPKTIDNDLSGTDQTIGFDTAVTIAAEAIDRLHTTAESHQRVMVVEVMGRHAGWIALYSGIAGGADVIIIPEVPVNFHEVAELIIKRHNRGKNFSIVVVAEGAKIHDEKGERLVVRSTQVDEFGHVQLGGIGEVLGKFLKDATDFDTRVTNLGHIQRGGTPTAFDRVLATRFGVLAVDLVANEQYGKMSAWIDGKFVASDITEVKKGYRTVPEELYKVAEVFFG